MSSLVKLISGGRHGARSDWPSLSFEDFASWFNFGGLGYPLTPSMTLAQEREEPPSDFAGYISQLYYQNGIVFACMAARQRIFSQARMTLQRLPNGQPGELFGSTALAPLEHPWGPSSTTSDLLGRMILDADLAGNAYVTNQLPGQRVAHLRPDWVTIVAGSRRAEANPLKMLNPNWQIDAEIAGYIYWPGGRSGEQPELILPENMAHFAPHPDPAARFRGMSWLTPVVREVLGDKAATLHKEMFFTNGATPNIVVSLGENVTPENFQKFVELFEEQNEGVLNAYKTLFFGGGANVEVVGANLRQLDFKVTQGAGESRIAAAAGVPPIIPGFSEGLQYATYSNYGQARRAFADTTLAHLWSNACGTLEPLIDIPSGGTPARLWYDAQHIAFLKEDLKDEAAIQQVNASTINTLITAGFNPDDVVKAVMANQLEQLIGKHTGMISVQLFKPGEKKDTGDPSQNGTGDPKALPAPAE